MNLPFSADGPTHLIVTSTNRSFKIFMWMTVLKYENYVFILFIMVVEIPRDLSNWIWPRFLERILTQESKK